MKVVLFSVRIVCVCGVSGGNISYWFICGFGQIAGCCYNVMNKSPFFFPNITLPYSNKVLSVFVFGEFMFWGKNGRCSCFTAADVRQGSCFTAADVRQGSWFAATEAWRGALFIIIFLVGWRVVW